MTRDRISEAVGNICPAYIEEAAAYTVKKRRRAQVWLRAAAACLCLVVGLAALLPGTRQDERAVLPIAERWPEGYGNGGYWAYESAELVSGNPWREEMELTALPVYYNNLTYDADFVPEGADAEKMRQRLLETAGRFGLAAGELTVIEGPRSMCVIRADGSRAETREPQWLAVQTDTLRLEVDQRLNVTATFTPALSLPEEIHFSMESSYEELLAAADYLLETYGGLLAMEEPQIVISGGEYDVYGQQIYSLAFFDAGGSDAEDVLCYNLEQARFFSGVEGGLEMIRFFQPDVSWYLGSYPIITAAEARERLLDGRYIASALFETPEEAHIERVELVYRTGEYELCYMPCYRFYVELPEQQCADGMRTFGTYDVPAVEGQYLEGMPTGRWPGLF